MVSLNSTLKFENKASRSVTIQGPRILEIYDSDALADENISGKHQTSKKTYSSLLKRPTHTQKNVSECFRAEALSALDDRAVARE